MLSLNQKKGRLPKCKQVLEDIDISKPATDFAKEDITSIGESITKKSCDSQTPKGNTMNNIIMSLFHNFSIK
jgi:hypothetical protein